MLRLSNISIGIKMAAMSAVSILLVFGMIGAQLLGNARTRESNDTATRQALVARNMVDAKASERGMQMGVRDIRLAATKEHLDKANQYLAARYKSVSKFIAESLPLSVSKENVDRMNAAKSLADQYFAGAKEIEALRAKVVALRSKGTLDAEAAKQVTQIAEQAERIARERTLPLAAKFEDTLNQIVDFSKNRSEQAIEEAHSDTAFAERVSIVIGVLAVVLLIGSALLGAMTIAKPLRALVKPLEEIAGGNFAVEVPGVGRRDEVGQIAGAVGAMAEKVSTTIAEIKASGREVTNASAEISTSTTDLSQRTEEQAASLEETSAAMEELSATVRTNAENAQQANQSASTTRDVADRGGQVVAQAVEAMAKIEDSSRKIGDIIGVIDEIARQTNLLALNAAVEAARAGEAGRGFAVVASEVRSLAQRSSQAAKDIKDLITNSNGQVKDGVDLVNKAGAALNEIVESIKSVATIVADIANASTEQATGIEQINKALTQMDEVTQQNSALVEENAATAKTLEHQAKAMDDQVAFFQIGNEGEVQSAPRAREPAERQAPKPRAAALTAKAPAPATHKPVTQLKQGGAGNSGGPVRKMQATLATAVNADADWKEF
jgi:methyl-accepting chemotaxis protein